MITQNVDVERQSIENFLFRVANDEAYRHQLTTNPIETCAAVGILIAEDAIPEGGIELPSSSVIMQHLTKIADDFGSYLCMPKHCHLIWTPAYINSLSES